MNPYIYTRNIRKAAVGFIILLLTGCSTVQSPSNFQIQQQNLLKKCPDELPSEYGKTGDCYRVWITGCAGQ
jgi:hypothetical protein